MLPIFWWDQRRRQLPWTRSEFGRVAFLGTIGVGFNQFFFLLGVGLTTVSHAALIVGLMRAAAISWYAELEMLAIYLVVIVVLVARPAGLFGKPVE